MNGGEWGETLKLFKLENLRGISGEGLRKEVKMLCILRTAQLEYSVQFQLLYSKGIFANRN